MNFLAFLVALVIFCFILTGVIWIGFHIVLPIVVFFAILSLIGAVVAKFVPNAHKHPHKVNQKNKQNQVIDVEFEEVKE